MYCYKICLLFFTVLSFCSGQAMADTISPNISTSGDQSEFYRKFQQGLADRQAMPTIAHPSTTKERNDACYKQLSEEFASNRFVYHHECNFIMKYLEDRVSSEKGLISQLARQGNGNSERWKLAKKRLTRLQGIYERYLILHTQALFNADISFFQMRNQTDAALVMHAYNSLATEGRVPPDLAKHGPFFVAAEWDAAMIDLSMSGQSDLAVIDAYADFATTLAETYENPSTRGLVGSLNYPAIISAFRSSLNVLNKSYLNEIVETARARDLPKVMYLSVSLQVIRSQVVSNPGQPVRVPVHPDLADLFRLPGQTPNQPPSPSHSESPASPEFPKSEKVDRDLAEYLKENAAFLGPVY
ncbi:MAG: hypothetical protein COT74_05175 [Bdellovibrionales bacterium CG10_big_fil_rev_8_21_14_0_10_45_34]|nr:MAG: hypothetical protein COT74_05175 [Bdellovibrionales bacterium CG10_big_fil_rev_8_21_14_0_10_45_34]